VEQLSYDDDGEIVHYKWDFGDGTTGEGENPFHYYEKEGKYFVELTVTDNDDFDDTIIKEVEVYAENIPPKAVLLTNSSSNTEDINFVWQFDGSGSSDPGGKICNYKFEIRRHPDDHFIDEFEGNRNNIVYVFKTADLGGGNKNSAKFKVTLTVTDDLEGTDDIAIIITVNDT
jgi:PKD repeat protein